MPESVNLNWFAMLAHHARRDPEKPLAVFEGETVSYGQMAERAAALAGGLSERGVAAGDVVAILSHNRVYFVDTLPQEPLRQGAQT